ncbi:MAG: hypothetical protein R3F55_15655 [Alphaproteobacteria bacterium]
MSARRAAIAAALLAVTSAATALAAEPYEPFLGTYVGRAEAGTNAAGEPEIRDIDVTITSTDHGFRIESITVNHHGDRLSPDVRRRSSVMSFVESDIDGVYRRDFQRDVFATRGETNMVAGDALQWARIADGVLLVYSFVLEDDGYYELAVFRRALNDSGLDLTFSSERDGEVGRTVTGRLIRVEDVMDDINP